MFWTYGRSRQAISSIDKLDSSYTLKLQIRLLLHMMESILHDVRDSLYLYYIDPIRYSNH
jgi:hypothetical protein